MSKTLEAPSRAPRFDVTLGVTLPDGEAVTRNVSATGVYLVTKSPIRVGAALEFSLGLKGEDGVPLRMRCSGKVVRVTEQDGELGIAVEFQSYNFETGESADA